MQIVSSGKIRKIFQNVLYWSFYPACYESVWTKEKILQENMFEGLDSRWNYVYLGPDVQSSVSLTSSLVVKMLTVLVSTISNSQVFLLKKCE